MRRRSEEAWDQLATKIPQTVRRALKLYCAKADMSVQDFVTRALREKLDREGRRDRRRRDWSAVQPRAAEALPVCP